MDGACPSVSLQAGCTVLGWPHGWAVLFLVAVGCRSGAVGCDQPVRQPGQGHRGTGTAPEAALAKEPTSRTGRGTAQLVSQPRADREGGEKRGEGEEGRQREMMEGERGGRQKDRGRGREKEQTHASRR